jgi:hypothetical protein
MLGLERKKLQDGRVRKDRYPKVPPGTPVAASLSVHFVPEAQEWGLGPVGGELMVVPPREHVRGEPIPVEVKADRERVTLDAWTVRSDFLKAQTHVQVLEFLRRTGMFTKKGVYNEEGVFTNLDAELTFEDLRWVQAWLPKLQHTPIADWGRLQAVRGSRRVFTQLLSTLNAGGLPLTLWKKGVSIGARNTLEALAATIIIDQIRSARYGRCSRPNCRKEYEMATRHEQKYCSDACAKAESKAAYNERERVFRERLHGSTPRLKSTRQTKAR